MIATPEPRPEVIELLCELATRNLIDGPDAGGIAWSTRHAWSTALERSAALGRVLHATTAALAMYAAEADQQDARMSASMAAMGLAADFVEAAWLDSIGVAPFDVDRGDA